jgi:hypothetical protein
MGFKQAISWTKKSIPVESEHNVADQARCQASPVSGLLGGLHPIDHFINNRLKAMMTMPPMRPKTLSCPSP